MLDYLGQLKRTHTNGQLRASDAGANVVLMGWVNRRRDLGTLIFVDLRDRTGITQVVFNAEQSKDIHTKASSLRSEFVIAVLGTVKKREPNTINKKVNTGDIEVVATELRVLNDSKTPPFSIADDEVANEEVRLKYRYLDLRRGPLQANIELRHKVALAIRNDLAGRGFLEIETPFMTRSTPEGARDYLVPSRVHPGSFYALPQSPQLFKQILMISGFDKYFQIVRCFRDEDLRADRQPEFTQLDLEMTYPQQETVFAVVESFLTAAFKAAGHDLKTPFPRMTYDQAIAQYGSDKPDLRLPAMVDVKERFTPEMCTALKIDRELPIVAIRIPNTGEFSRKDREKFRVDFKFLGHPRAILLDDLKRLEKTWPGASQQIILDSQASENDLVVVVAGKLWTEQVKEWDEKQASAEARLGPIPIEKHRKIVFWAAGGLRLWLAKEYAERHKLFEKTGDVDKDFRLTWVTDFPMFEWDEDGKRWAAAHHPFTSPHEHDMDKLAGGLEAAADPNSPLGKIRALAYDVVLNGTELGSGSIRIHRQDVQKQIFRALGMTDDEAKSRFGFFLDALEFGTPPHGGIALGLDRIVMLLAGADSLREVIPFPKTAQAKDLMVDAPTPVSEQQLKELGLKGRS